MAEHMFSEETKQKVVQKLNENVDIPIISEATEEKIIEALWATVEEALKETLFKEQ
jgi:nucleoid DNA-binding protein|tara:strand:- start:1283 stop:1450 length:168 start_codon:yes stop_codon:yes gene_type:complete